MTLHLLHKNTSESVRELAMLRLSFGGVLRGHQLREGDYADFHSVVLENMGYSRCVALVFVLDHGKTDQSGRLKMAGMIRAKDFLTCPLFATALHCFHECVFPSLFDPPILLIFSTDQVSYRQSSFSARRPALPLVCVVTGLARRQDVRLPKEPPRAS